METFTEQAVAIIQAIPPGRVMTYGQVAAEAGNPRGARQISRILHSMSAKYELPWHRVINAQGGISTPENAQSKGETQRERLLAEGVQFNENGRVSLDTYRWHPD
ncbi:MULTISPECIES: MGMT family protein [unclassified Sporosarcina]|uniref:MGMT family protein n=1 Tax=unclassified Sporosarcina TaxID=2647733 RepID=UPI000C16AD8F|nr:MULTISPECIES: MGMT family protein [unclassified Sporosarcina]PID03292.1 DNA methyltransferase [Sporosarcina sp. P2]PID26147.1 DNA methyltransferase [Sporosarcina sp. P7]